MRVFFSPVSIFFGVAIFFGSVGLVPLALVPLALAMPPGGMGGGAHEGYGQGLPSDDLPVGVLTVKVVAGGNMAWPHVGAKVELMVGPTGETSQATIATGKDGRARFTGLMPGTTYRARVKGVTASTARSQVVTMPQQGGLRLLLSTPGAPASRPANASGAARAEKTTSKSAAPHKVGKTHDVSVLSLISGTHVLGQVGEGSVQFMQVLVLNNASKDSFDPGQGLVFPLPQGARNPGLGAGSQGKLRVSDGAKSVVLVSSLPPGTTTMRFTYQMVFESSRLDFLQVLPVRQEPALFAITNNPMVELQGPAIERRELRDQGKGVKLPVYILRAMAPKSGLEFTLTELPYRDQTLRNVTIGVSIALFLWGVFGVAFGGRRARARGRLLDELAALMATHEAGGLPEEGFVKERAELLRQLRCTWDE
ncbi:MAG: fibronectin type III domain-containing protein [Deltaproteobacteria bacterium]|nr:fibronectin type III domain-containing protein [Deltaproteobacteria bacterium]